MKNTLFHSLLLLFISLSAKSQTSQFMGNVNPSVSHLIEADNLGVEPKNHIIKPNFKGRELVEVDNSNTHLPDWVWQQHEITEKNAAATKLWDVQGLGSNLSPPDPSGEADSLYYIQATNSFNGSSYRIMNKYTGATVGSSTYTMQTLGGPAGAGDPIVLYYKQAKKWFLTEFSSSGNKLLVHVSQTSNPQGAYWTYQFTCTQFPDYPKWSICPTSDALLVTTNEGGPPTTYAMKLSALINGATSPFIKIAIGYSLNGFGFQSITPVDIEGDFAAPAGMKPLFVRHRDDESHSNGSPDSGNNDWIELWEMTINWTNNTATVAKIQDISIAEIDSKLCGLTSFTCIAQPNTTVKLDPLRETVMFKAPMRIFESHQAMVLSLSTDVNGADRAGVRWIELRRESGVTTPTWYKYQEGTYAPGTSTSRWMPAINIDKWGNIIMAYSTSSNSVGDFPSLKMTGRKPCDPLNVMTMPETTLIAGTGSKTGDTRWGDYHHMCIDDFDGETFYYTGVYYAGGTKTRNIAIKMDAENLDASVAGLFQVANGDICGTSAQIGIIIENRGITPITSGSFSWQIGTGNATNVNYSSTQLISLGSRDTIFVFVNGLNAGANTVNVSLLSANGTADDNSCNDTKSVSISVSGAQSFTTSTNVITQPTCTANIGSVQLQTNGGSAPFTYSMNSGAIQTDPTFSNLAPGSYTYTITDNTGCSITDVFNLTTPYSISSNYTQTTTINCFGESSAEISISASGGQGGYVYSIDGNTFQSGSVFSNLSAGEYQVISKDANGCLSEITLEITQPNQLILNAIPTMISCFGNNNGSISVNVSGGTPTYVSTINSANGLFTGLSAGNYTITSTDANGCIQTFNTTITEPSQVTLTGVPTSATAGSSNGSITMTGSGGLSPYTYSINGTNYYSGTLFSNLAAGTYTCYVKDANGCVNSVVITVDEVANLDEFDFQLFNLYPNPNNGIFELEVDGLKEDKLLCKLFNLQGQLVSEFNLEVVNGKVNKTIEMSKKLASGTYYLGLYENDKALIKQFVKQ
jgi:hypothetical protein